MARRSLCLILVFAAALALAAPAAAEIKIGVLLPNSGKASQYGITQEVGLRIAEAELEKLKIKGEPVKLIIYDTRGENADAINLTRKLIGSDKVLAIVGPFFSGRMRGRLPDRRPGQDPDHHRDLGQAGHRRQEPAMGLPQRPHVGQARRRPHRSLAGAPTRGSRRW